ncbi:MAG: alpha-D-ribose 1-methylphosphonate 5-triphosphate diphosphatase [Pseudomonadota bacterium]
MATVRIVGAQVILPDDIVETEVTYDGDRIVELGGGAAEIEFDGRGLYLAPALVDIHGDAFERQIMPRPGVFFPLDGAVLETDRQLAANGIATAYHAITLGWEPGLRDVGRGRELIEMLNRLAPRLTVENRVQLRWETFAFEAIDLIEEVLRGPLSPAIAFNDHTSMTVRAFDVPIQERAFEQSPDFRIATLDDDRLKLRTANKAHRSGVSDDDYIKLLSDVWERRADVGAMIEKVAALGRAAGAPMLSHDDTREETRAYYRGLGASISEFPMVMEAAKAAHDAGEPIVFGAPNAVRGGSHIGSLGAGDMVEAGMCDALASDYYYPALLAAVARLDAERRASRPSLWSLVSRGPARASGLEDRGEIAVGQRADLVLLNWPDEGAPSVLNTICAGRMAYQARPQSHG